MSLHLSTFQKVSSFIESGYYVICHNYFNDDNLTLNKFSDNTMITDKLF